MVGSPMITMMLFLGVIGLMFAIQKHRNSGLGVTLLLVFTFVMGLMLGPLLLIPCISEMVVS